MYSTQPQSFKTIKQHNFIMSIVQAVHCAHRGRVASRSHQHGSSKPDIGTKLPLPAVLPAVLPGLSLAYPPPVPAPNPHLNPCGSPVPVTYTKQG
jgi:hypothetical protein